MPRARASEDIPSSTGEAGRSKCSSTLTSSPAANFGRAILISCGSGADAVRAWCCQLPPFTRIPTSMDWRRGAQRPPACMTSRAPAFADVSIRIKRPASPPTDHTPKGSSVDQPFVRNGLRSAGPILSPTEITVGLVEAASRGDSVSLAVQPGSNRHKTEARNAALMSRLMAIILNSVCQLC